MPVSCKKIDGKWRLCGPDGKPEMSAKGKAVDGGGHATEAECGKQAAAMNMSMNKKSEWPDLSQVRGYIAGDEGWRSFGMTPASWKEEERSVESCMATEEMVRVFDFKEFRIVNEVLRMDGYVAPPGNRLPLLDAHDAGSVRSVLGSTRDIRVSGKTLIGRSVISSTEPVIAQKVKDGDITDNSLSYIVHARETLAPGETREVKGTVYTARDLPLQIAMRWEPKENSLTPIGADSGAKIRSYVNQLEVQMDKEETKPPAEETEVEETKPPAEEKSRRDVLAEITPKGYEALLEESVMRGMDLDGFRKALLAEHAKRHAPVGTPEPTRPASKETGKNLKDMPDDAFKRAWDI